MTLCLMIAQVIEPGMNKVLHCKEVIYRTGSVLFW